MQVTSELVLRLGIAHAHRVMQRSHAVTRSVHSCPHITRRTQSV